MTYPNDNSNNNGNPLYERSYTGWIITACIAVAAVFAIYMMSGRNNLQSTATNPRPTVSAPATTGSGTPSSAIPNNPNGTAPQPHTDQPTPAPR